MAVEGGPTAAPLPPHARGGTERPRRRHRRGRGNGKANDSASLANDSVSASISMLPGSSMLCREANEAHIALLSTLPPHIANSAALLGAPILHPENEHQQMQNEKMIREFKTLPCGMEGQMSSHDHRCCPYFHSERDRRRMVYGEGPTPLYSAEPCNEQFDDQRVCSQGEACGLCHSTAELLYHPDFFRKRLCHQAKRCPRGKFCAFAHSRQELLVPHFTEMEEVEPTEDFIAWRFKTQWCPIGGPHDWENCVYAHTYRDWRRVPTLGYSSRPCPHWVQSVTTGPAELLYADRCPRGMSCPLAHGAKEQLYHPQFYKTSPCSEANCKRGALCAFTHGAHDIRRPRGDDPLPSAVREPILQAVELLGRSQPTFWSPPRYHALEDPPAKGSNSHPKGRSRGGSSSNALPTQQQGLPFYPDGSPSNRTSNMEAAFSTDGQLLPAALPSVHPMNGHGQNAVEHSPQGYSPYSAPHQYPFCQWVPMGQEAPTQLIPPSMGYGQVMDSSWTMPMAYSPWVCGAYMQQAPPNGGMQPGVSPYLMTVPASPQHGDGNHELGVEQDSPDRMNTGVEVQGFSMDMGEMPNMPTYPEDIGGFLQIDGMPSWPSADPDDYHTMPSNRYLSKGLRTPSSLGSPPLSGAPTEVPSPRIIEADSNQGSVYQDGSSDDAGQIRGPPNFEAIADAANHAFCYMPPKEVQYMGTSPMKMPVVEPMEEHLALQNFMEAPCPSSPSR